VGLSREKKERKRKRKQNQFKFEIDTSNLLKLDLIQTGPFQLKQFEIKYGWKAFEIRNNFSYRNLFGFEMNFELKFREIFRSRKQGKIDWEFLGTRILMKLGQQLPFYTLLQGKLNSQQNQIKILNFF
jgi:hypothetical protein